MPANDKREEQQRRIPQSTDRKPKEARREVVCYGKGRQRVVMDGRDEIER